MIKPDVPHISNQFLSFSFSTKINLVTHCIVYEHSDMAIGYSSSSNNHKDEGFMDQLYWRKTHGHFHHQHGNANNEYQNTYHQDYNLDRRDYEFQSHWNDNNYHTQYQRSDGRDGYSTENSVRSHKYNNQRGNTGAYGSYSGRGRGNIYNRHSSSYQRSNNHKDDHIQRRGGYGGYGGYW